MSVYLIFLFSVVILCSFRIKKNASRNYLYPFALIGWVVIILFSGLRYGIGTDYFSYEAIFYSIDSGGSYNESLEPGFKFLGSLFSNTKNGFYCFIFLLSTITNVFFLFAIYKESEKISENLKALSLILFFLTSTYFWPFNGVRQGIACSFIVFSLRYIFRRDFIRFCLCVVIAALFHKSAIVVVFIYFLYGVRLSSFFYLCAVLASIIIHQTGVVSLIGQMLLPYLGEKYARYIYNPLNFGGSGLGVYVYVIIFFVLWWCGAYVKKNIIHKNDVHKQIDYYLCLFTIGLILRVFALDNLIFVRFAYYFTIFDMLFIPYLISQFIRLSNRIALSLFFIFIYFILFINSIMNSNDLLPYDNIFFR